MLKFGVNCFILWMEILTFKVHRSKADLVWWMHCILLESKASMLLSWKYLQPWVRDGYRQGQSACEWFQRFKWSYLYPSSSKTELKHASNLWLIWYWRAVSNKLARLKWSKRRGIVLYKKLPTLVHDIKKPMYWRCLTGLDTQFLKINALFFN